MEYLRTSQEIVMRSTKNFGATSHLMYKISSCLTRVIGLVFIFFIKFLLIRQVEGLDLIFTLNGF